MSALGSRCCARAFSGCGVWVSHCGGFSSRGAPLSSAASAVVAPAVSCPAACGVFMDQGSKRCLLQWILNHWTTREALNLTNFYVRTLQPCFQGSPARTHLSDFVSAVPTKRGPFRPQQTSCLVPADLFVSPPLSMDCWLRLECTPFFSCWNSLLRSCLSSSHRIKFSFVCAAVSQCCLLSFSNPY